MAVSSGCGTGSEVDTLWVLASVAGGSALPWKAGHLGASWKGSLPGRSGARWPPATTSSEPLDQHGTDGALDRPSTGRRDLPTATSFNSGGVCLAF